MKELKEFTYSDIREELFRLKSKEMRTNFFITEIQFNRLLEKELIKAYITLNACFLLVQEKSFVRLYFIISNDEVLETALDNLQLFFVGVDVCIEIAGKKESLQTVTAIFENKGFYTYSSLVRMNRMRKANEVIELEDIYLLNEDKKEELQRLFTKYFDKFVERIPDIEEIDELIKNKSIYYYSDDSNIQGFVIFESHGATSHLRYWFVHPDYREKRIGSKLIKAFFSLGDSVKRELFWVIESNTNAIKRYKHYGFVEENMHNLILLNKNIKYEE